MECGLGALILSWMYYTSLHIWSQINQHFFGTLCRNGVWRRAIHVNFQRSLAKNQAGNSRGTPRGITGIFFRGGKVIFPDFFPDVKCFFPVENSNFGTPKTNFRRRQKWKAKKKKKKKKRVLTSFYSFSYFQFKFSTFPFTNFLLYFSIFTLFPFFSPIRQQKFPGQKSLGGTLPPTWYATGHTFEAPH